MPLADRASSALRLRWLDVRDRLGGRREALVPPRTLVLGGHADFVSGGDELLGHLVTLAGLQPHERVLDVGCGTGRLARPLTGYLDSDGSYEGIDADRRAIGWCRRRYRRHRSFRFRVADVYSRRFNPSAGQAPGDYRLPFADGTFDVVVLADQLTRLLEGEVEHAIAEASRVLRPGGRLLATLFLLTDESRAAIASGQATLPFLDAEAHVAVLSDEVPEEAVAYDEAWVRERLGEHGLAPRGPVQQGSWIGDVRGLSFADVLVAQRGA